MKNLAYMNLIKFSTAKCNPRYIYRIEHTDGGPVEKDMGDLIDEKRNISQQALEVVCIIYYMCNLTSHFMPAHTLTGTGRPFIERE